LPPGAPLPEVDAPSLRRYFDYLSSALPLPLPALYVEEEGPDDHEVPHPVFLLALLPPPAHNLQAGVLAQVLEGHEAFALPLETIRCAPNNPAYQLLADYRFWLEEAPGAKGGGPFFAGLQPGSWRGSLRSLLLLALGCAPCGAAVAAVYEVVGWAQNIVPAASALLAVGGVLLGGLNSGPFRRPNRQGAGLLLGAVFGGLAGAALGALLAAVVLAFVGSILGAISGTVLARVLGWLKAPSPGELPLTLLGAVLGALGQALSQDWDRALSAAVHGAGLGALAGPLYVVAFVVALYFVLGAEE
jgi:hypothetical protein